MAASVSLLTLIVYLDLDSLWRYTVFGKGCRGNRIFTALFAYSNPEPCVLFALVLRHAWAFLEVQTCEKGVAMLHEDLIL